MDRETLMTAIRKGPVEIAMNDGKKIIVPNLEFCVVDDIAAHVLYRADDGKWRTQIASLVCITTVSQLSTSEEN